MVEWEDIIDQYAYKTGFGMFRQMGASSVEITVEKLDSSWTADGRPVDDQWTASKKVRPKKRKKRTGFRKANANDR